MKTLLVFCLFLLHPFNPWDAQEFLSGTIRYELNYHIPEQGRRAMEKSGFSVTTGMEIKGDGSGLNIKILSANGVKMEILYSKNFSGYIDRPNRKAYRMPDGVADTTEDAHGVTKTDEYETIFGHQCRKYIVEQANGIKQIIWACPEFKTAYGIYEHLSGDESGDESVARQIDGVPLQITSAADRISFDMKTVSIENSKPENAEFVLPADFKVLPYDKVAIGKMLMGEQQ